MRLLAQADAEPDSPGELRSEWIWIQQRTIVREVCKVR